MTKLAPTLEFFFTTYLPGQQGASSHTVTAYRDTWRLLLVYLQDQHHLSPAHLDFQDLNATTITGFLTYLQDQPGNSNATRNARLAAIHAFFSYAAYRHPEHAQLIAHILALQPKKAPKAQIDFLDDDEVQALLSAPDTNRKAGRRDQLIIHTLISTGLRVSELTSLTWSDISLSTPPYLACHGKGRKDRTTPLDQGLVELMRQWHTETTTKQTPATTPVFTAQGTQRALSSDAIAQRLNTHVTTAAKECPSLTTKIVSPHVLRHTTAMRMLAAGIDIATIALWLGHESIASTRVYLHADMTAKQRTLDRMAPPQTPSGRYQPNDDLLNS